MKNKNAAIITIVVLSVCIIVMLGVMLFLMFGGKHYHNFSRNPKEVIYQKQYQVNQFEQIRLDLVSSDIDIRETSNDHIELRIIGREKNEFTIDDQGMDLYVKKEKQLCFGICFNDTQVILYIPRDYQNPISVETYSGDVKIEGEILANFDIKTLSGDVEADDLKTAKIDTQSGDVEIDRLGNFQIVTASGDIEIDRVEMTENSEIATHSGDVEIKRTNQIRIEADTTSGEKHILESENMSKVKLRITTRSGDIEVN